MVRGVYTICAYTYNQGVTLLCEGITSIVRPQSERMQFPIDFGLCHSLLCHKNVHLTFIIVQTKTKKDIKSNSINDQELSVEGPAMLSKGDFWE